MTEREVLKLALEAMEGLINKTSGQAIYSFMETERRIAMSACVAIKEALAQPEQEPVAWTVQRFYDDGTPHPCRSLEWAGRNAEDDFPIGTKFYTATQATKKVVL